MALTCYLRQITPAELDQYQNEQEVEEEWFGGPDTISLDFAWEDLLTLFTGSLERSEAPLARAILGNQCLDDPSLNDEPDVYLGYTYYLTPEEVSTVAPEVLKITVEQLRDKLNTLILDDEGNVDLTKVDLNVDAEDILKEFETLDILKEFETLRDFYESASQKGNAVFMSVD